MYPKIQLKLSWLILLLINFIFLIKYIERVTSYYFIITFSITVIYYFISQFPQSLKIKDSYKIAILWTLVLSYFILSIILFKKIPQASLNVDRFSVITSFWDSFHQGDYAYSAHSHMGNLPGAMPFYFILAYPFYLIGELGFFSLMGLVIFILILKYSKLNINDQFSGILLVISSAFYLWETITRSNLFLNSSLILFAILYFLKTLQMNRLKHLIINGVIIGLLLSTRNVMIIPFIALFSYVFINKIYSFTDIMKIGLVIALVFSITFFPFVINHLDEFLVLNPFTTLSSFLMPSWLSLICISLSFASLFLIRKTADIFFCSGIFIFITMLIYAIYHLYLYGLQVSFFESKVDISYFILSIPFFIYYVLIDEKKLEFQINDNLRK